MNPVDPNFDWVTARAECRPATVLLALQEQAKSDVEKRNSMLITEELRYGIKFQIIRGRGTFRVDRTDFAEQPLDFVLFHQTNDGIAVSYKDDQTGFIGTLTLSNEGECKLRLASNEECSFWQFRKQALEPLFFYGELGW